MVLPLPDALSQFSQSSLKSIEALDAIQQSVTDVQSSVQSNITNAATESITGAGDLFESVPDFAAEANLKFLTSIATPPVLQNTLQQDAFGQVFGSNLTGGGAVDGFLDANVRLEDIIPAQQLFQIVQNLGGDALYVDPLQAYAHVNQASNDLKNLCEEADGIIASIQIDTGNLLTLQGGLNYAQIGLATTSFYASVSDRQTESIAKFKKLKATFDSTGKYEPGELNDFCMSLDEVSNLVMFGNAKFIEFDRLRKTIDGRLHRLQEIARELPAIAKSISGFVPTYIASASFGKLFNAIQSRVVDQTGIQMGKVLKDIEALSSLSAGDRSKLLANFGMAASLQAIKAYICKIQPATKVVDVADPVIGPLKTGYDGFAADLEANDTTSLFASLDAQVSTFSSTSQTCFTRNSGAELTTEASSLGAILTPLALFLTNTCGAADAFRAIFASTTAAIPERVTGALELFQDSGLDAAREVGIGGSFDQMTELSLSESTKPGELANAIRERIAQLPDGNEKDQLTLVYASVYARHRATVISMDFQQREATATFLSLTEEEENRRLVNEATKTFSGLEEDEFDPITTDTFLS
jgi:hypothetical protein